MGAVATAESHWGLFRGRMRPDQFERALRLSGVSDATIARWIGASAEPEAREPDRKWFVIETEPQQESIAAAHLFGRGFATYLPGVLKEVRAGHGKRNVARPMFPGYLFVSLDLLVDPYGRIFSLPGVRGMLKTVGGGLAILRATEFASIKSQEFVKLSPDEKNVRKFTVGQRVRVTEGAFESCIGQIERLDDHERVSILLSLFGRSTPVDLAEDHLESLG